MIYGEQYIMSMAHVVHAKVDAGLVGSRPYHQEHHSFRDIYVVLPLCILVSTIILLSVTLALDI